MLWDPTGGFHGAGVNVLDAYQRLMPVEMPDSDIPVVFAEIDEAALDEYGQWPWPRDELAKLIIQLYEQGASVVALDMLQAEPDRTSPSVLAARLNIDDSPLANEYGYTNWDKFFADVLAQTPTVLALGADPSGETNTPSPITWASIGSPANDHLPNFTAATVPMQSFEDVASGLGVVSIRPDYDGLIRSVPALTQIDGQVFLTLGLESLRVAQNLNTVATRADDYFGLESLKIGGYQVLLNSDGGIRLAYTALDTVERISLADIDRRPIPPQSLVILGASALGLKDIHDSPQRLSIPGPLYHAATMNQVLTGTYLIEPLWSDTLSVLALFVGVWVLFAFARTHALGVTLSVTAGALVLVIGGCWYSFIEHRWLLDYSGVTLAWGFAMASGVGLRLTKQEADRSRIRQAFATYLAPALVDQITDQPEQLQLGGETKPLSIMFADLRGFTTLSEQYRDRPQALTELVNQVMSPMSQAILDHQGTIDKYLGDCVMAFWNAPLPTAQHPEKAVRAALAIQRAVAQLNRRLGTDADGTSLRVAIGINTGEVVVGNFGSEQRFDYTCIGDPVNLCSRLEGLCRHYDVDILVGQATVEAMTDSAAFSLMPLDRVAVKGKTEPSLVYWACEPSAFTDFEGVKLTHLKMLEAFWAARWSVALDCLSNLSDEAGYPAILAAQYRERIAQQQKRADAADWSGIFAPTSK